VFTKLQKYWDYLVTVTSVAVDRNTSQTYSTVSTPPVGVKTLQDGMYKIVCFFRVFSSNVYSNDVVSVFLCCKQCQAWWVHSAY
jgi:hypothetical protein